MKNLTFDIESLDFYTIGQSPIIARISVWLIVFCVALYVAYSFLLEESLLVLEEKNNQCRVLQQELDDIEGQLKSADSLNDEQQKVDMTLENLNRQLPVKNDPASLLEEISKQALQCRLQIRTVKPQPDIQKGFYVEYPITLSMVGDFHGLGEFADRLSNMSPIIILKDYVLNKHKTYESLEMQIVINSYGTASASEDAESIEQQSKVTSIEPIPELEPLTVCHYDAKHLRSPFEKTNLGELDKPTLEQDVSLKGEAERAKELLEFYPLDSLKMVGFIAKNHEFFGLVRDGVGNIHRVKIGDYIGQNEGRVEGIDQNGINIQEKHYKDSLEPEERQITLPLSPLGGS